MAYKAPIWEDGKSPAISAENLNNLSQAAEDAQVLYGNSAPTSSTEGAVGQFYLVVVADSDGNYPLYQCVAITNGSYVWRDTRRIPDSITSMLGIPAPGTINRALNVLAHVGNLHVWERVQTYAEEVPAGYTLGELQENVLVFTGNNNSQSVLYYADSISVEKYGMVSLVSPSSYAFYANSNFSPGYYAKGKFFYIIPNTGSTAIDGIWFLPSDSNLNRDGAQYFAPTIQKVTGYAAIPAGTTTDYLTSTDRNAYPKQSAAGGQDAYYTLGNVVSGATIATLNTNSTVFFTVKKSDSVIVSEDGIVSLPSTATENEVWLNNDSDKDSIFADYKGCFVQLVGNGNVTANIKDVIWIPSDAVFSGLNSITVSKYRPVHGHAAIPANTTITYLGQLGGGARIEVGSYVGTGTDGSANPNKLTFLFEPKLLIIRNVVSSNERLFLSIVKSGRYVSFLLSNSGSNVSSNTGEITLSGNTVSWYAGGPNAQMNASKTTYNYIVIG